MADLATLRAGCQRGEMPTWGELVASDSRIVLTPLYIHGYSDGFHLDALAALQEALWQGSVMECLYNETYKVWVSGRGAGHDCPTLATAWLDAILAGLQDAETRREALATIHREEKRLGLK